MLLAEFAVHTVNAAQDKPNQKESAVLAKVAIEWLFFDDWVKLKPENANIKGIASTLARLRSRLQSSKTSAYRIGIMATSNQIEYPALYDRTTKTLVTKENDPLGSNSAFLYVTIVQAEGGWNVEIYEDGLWFNLEIKREDNVYYVSKLRRMMIGD